MSTCPSSALRPPKLEFHRSEICEVSEVSSNPNAETVSRAGCISATVRCRRSASRISAEALSIIEQAKRHARGGFLFPSTKKGVISDMTLGMFMRRAGLDARPHGFRSSLRDWLAEATDAPHEVAETVLQHVAGSKVTRAYRRTDFIEQRRALMERWADHVTGKSGQVVKLVASQRHQI